MAETDKHANARVNQWQMIDILAALPEHHKLPENS